MVQDELAMHAWSVGWQAGLQLKKTCVTEKQHTGIFSCKKRIASDNFVQHPQTKQKTHSCVLGTVAYPASDGLHENEPGVSL